MALILSKMGTGKGVAFSEKWYDKMANPNIKTEDKTLTKFTEDYNQNFNPLDTKVWARRDLAKLYQKPGKDKDRTPNDGFQEYINEFENLANKAQFKDKLTAVTQFSTGLDQQISTMILSMQTPPDDLEGWIKKAKTFHNQKLHIDKLRKGIHYSNFRTQNTMAPQTPHDPDAMEVNTVKLKKLTPQEHAKCMREGRCFKCRKMGHDAKNCHTKMNTNPATSQPPQQVLHTEEVSATPSPSLPKSSLFTNYTQSLGKSEEELLQTLKLCYEEQDKEVRVAKTFKELQDF